MRILNLLILYTVRMLFYAYAILWTMSRDKANSMKDVLKLFYIDFLRVDPKDIEIVRLSTYELVTRCRNPCPILNISLRMKVDTKYSCKLISEPVCRYVLRKLNPNLVFERNYDHIRPYKDSCEERIYIP